MPLSKSMNIDGFGWWLHRRHIKASRREFDDGRRLFLRQMEPVHNLADRRANSQIVEHN
jgi:hypothetical protein